MKTFSNLDEIMKFLKTKKTSIKNASNNGAADYLLPIFASTVTNNPNNMVQVHRWLDLETETNIGSIVRTNMWKLKDVDLNLYKFKIICKVRGPVDVETLLDETVRKKPEDEYVVEAAKHKDFPEDGRIIMYEIHKDLDFLSPEAKEMFIF